MLRHSLRNPLSCIPIFFVLYLFMCPSLSSRFFLLAIASGLGFQIVGGFCLYPSGSAGRFLLHGVRDSRACGQCAMSHWVYTGLVMLGLFLIVQASRGRKDLALAGWGIISSWVWTSFCWQFTFLTNRDRVADCDSSLECYWALPDLPTYQTVERLEQAK